MSDILDLLDSDEVIPSTPAPATNTETKDDFDYWGDPNVTPVKINPDNFNRSEKSYTMTTFNQGEEIPEEYKKKLLELATALATKGFKFRHTGDEKDSLQNAILKIEGITVDTYLPWKKFNSNIDKPKMTRPKPCGYKIAAGLHKFFLKLPNGTRAVTARNTHAVLGATCDDPVNFILAYTKDGAEGFTKGMDFKVTGYDLSHMMNVAKGANVPIFNIKKDDSVKRLIEYLKNN